MNFVTNHVPSGRRNTRRTILAGALALALCASAPPTRAADPLPTVDQIYLAEQAGRTDDAQRMSAQVLAAHPNSAKAHYVQAELYARAGRISLARTELGIAEQLQPNLQFAKPRAIDELRAQLAERQTSSQGTGQSPPADHVESRTGEYRVLLAGKDGILVAPVVINNSIKLNFFVDSGASDVSIPGDIYSTLLRSGAITDADITGSRQFVNASGETSRATTFILRSLKVGTVEVLRVEASVAPVKAPPLLGQSFLKRFKSWSIDNASQELILRR
jgi:clan AA aspartic protease (TIGR02281 family)